jgi:hypothetical protein
MVLGGHEAAASPAGSIEHGSCLGRRRGQRLLAQNVRPTIKSSESDLVVEGGRQANAHDVGLLFGQHLPPVGVHAGNLVLLCHEACAILVSGTESVHRRARSAEGRQVGDLRDEPGARNHDLGLGHRLPPDHHCSSLLPVRMAAAVASP